MAQEVGEGNIVNALAWQAGPGGGGAWAGRTMIFASTEHIGWRKKLKKKKNKETRIPGKSAGNRGR